VAGYVIRGGERGYDRLRVLVRTWQPTTSALFDRAGIRPGARCLDLGCGTGEVTFDLARRAGPSGRAVGVDMDAVKLSRAREEAERKGLPNVEFRNQPVDEWSEADAYDVVYCRFFLEHLPDPVAVLRSMWAAVAKGGVLIAEDADFDAQFCDPPDAAFDFWNRTYQAALTAAGGHRLLGRQLHRIFREAGIPPPELTAVQRLDREGEAKTMPYLTTELTADAIVGAGIADRSEIDAAMSRLQELASDPEVLIGSPRIIQAWTRRLDA
jgi:ubiquinone/menaquinone biosynthesis C-methylase UbiE